MIALDTNILIYAVGHGDPLNRDDKARDLLDGLAGNPIVIPVQVLGEFLNATRKKQSMSSQVALASVEIWFEQYICPATQQPDLGMALELSTLAQLQFFDALIFIVAKRAGATVLVSEDMHDGLERDGLRIVNPFKPGNAPLILQVTAAG